MLFLQGYIGQPPDLRLVMTTTRQHQEVQGRSERGAPGSAVASSKPALIIPKRWPSVSFPLPVVLSETCQVEKGKSI